MERPVDGQICLRHDLASPADPDASDLKLHRLKTFKISNDPLFAAKVIDVIGLYLDPPDNTMMLSVDEKTQIQVLDAPSQYCSCAPARSSGAHTTTSALIRQACTSPSTS